LSQSSTNIIINGFSIVLGLKDLTPQYLSNLIPQNFGMIHDLNTRHTSSRIPPVRTRTSLYASYFIPSSVQLWNKQPENIKLMVWIYLSLVALWRGQCSRKWAVVSVAPHWQNGEFTMFLWNKWWLRIQFQIYISFVLWTVVFVFVR
jgi:hypothetical protein